MGSGKEPLMFAARPSPAARRRASLRDAGMKGGERWSHGLKSMATFERHRYAMRFGHDCQVDFVRGVQTPLPHAKSAASAKVSEPGIDVTLAG